MNLLWIFTMAWRDSRRGRVRLLLFMSSIVLGIAALVAINSFGVNLRNQVEKEARDLLSADLEVESRQPFDPSLQAFMDSVGVVTTREIGFGSMVLFPASGGTRLVNVRAVEAGFPFYGRLLTDPPEASVQFTHSRKALVDQTLMLQFNAKVGDEIKVGEVIFTIAGSVLKVPGQSGIASSVAPPVFIPLQYMEETNLIQRGSRINYSMYVKYPNGFDKEKVETVIRPRLDAMELNFEDVEGRKQQIGNAYDDMNGFLNLTAFVALLLGCIGVASSVHIYIKEKVASVATLRCIGASGYQAMGIYLVQVFMMGLIGSGIGALLGGAIQYLLPAVFSEILPFRVTTEISWSAVWSGITTGVFAAVLFALAPLMEIRRVPPLKALRASVEVTERDSIRWLVYGGLLLFVFLFSYLQLDTWKRALAFTLALIVAFGLLTLFSKLVIWLVKRFFPRGGSFILRQGLSNLFRPNNQTLVLVVTIGLGTILISSLIMSRQLLMDKIRFSSAGENSPNMVVFDIQDSDIKPISELTQSQGMPVLGTVPIVTMKLHAIEGRTVEDLRKDTTDGVRNWVLDREYRVTYRDSLISSEKISGGEWRGNVRETGDTVFISVSENMLDDMDVRVGSAVTFNVQGAIIKTIVGSVRKVDFQRVQPNFLIVFPAGVLENAPKFHVLMTRFASPEASAEFQRAVVSKFPNVSIIDLKLILQTVDDVLKKVSFIIEFMALFSLFTGIIVLAGSVILTRYQRIRESVILRTLGAVRKEIFGINALEYFLLGSLASLTGMLISVGLNMLLAQYAFNAVLIPDAIPLLICYLSITLITVLIGLSNTRPVVNKTPLEVLREV
jgi:putative ABC transport system permease protein